MRAVWMTDSGTKTAGRSPHASSFNRDPACHIDRELMKKLLLLLFGLRGTAAHGANLPQRYADDGGLIVTQLTSAPFPHPKRAEGHKYQGKVYSAKEHYSTIP